MLLEKPAHTWGKCAMFVSPVGCFGCPPSLQQQVHVKGVNRFQEEAMDEILLVGKGLSNDDHRYHSDQRKQYNRVVIT
jgi:hypothetical protein